MAFFVEGEPLVRICLPGGLYEPVLMEVLANAAAETAWSLDDVGAVVDSRGGLLLSGFRLNELIRGLQSEQARWSHAEETRGNQLRQLRDLDQLPAERMNDLMAWQHCVLRHEHATTLLALVRDAAAPEVTKRVRGDRQ